MNTFPAATRPATSRIALALIVVLVVCMTVAPSAAWAAADSSAVDGPAAAASPTPATALTPDEILAAIPPSTGTSLADKVESGALTQVRKTPQNAVAWVDLGDALAQIQRDTDDRKYYGYAEMTYQRALQVNPQSVDAMVGMAWAARGWGALDQSVDWGKRALALDEKNAAANGIIGDVALELGDYDGAFDHYQKMMDAKPDLSSWSRGATLLWITGNRSKAILLMERALKAGAPFAENTAWCRAQYAMMLFNDGATLPAAQVIAPALAAGSHNPEILLAAGAIAAAQQDFAAATQYYQKVLEKGPDEQALVALGDLCAAKGDKDGAEKYYTQVESLSKVDPAVGTPDPLFMAKFYADHDRNPGEALRLVTGHEHTKNVLEADTVAWVYFKNGDQPHAIAAMKFALSRNTGDAEMQFHAGMIAAAAGDRVSAQKHLQTALSYNPHFSVLEVPVALATLEKLGSATPTANGTKAP